MPLKTREEATLSVTSTAFRHGERIPAGFTCDGEDASPPLAFEGAPPGTRFFALIMDDPDAPGGTFLHWTFWDLPKGRASLAAGADVKALGAREGKTDFGSVGYGGPCPPPGTHRYFFHVFALGASLGLREGATLDELEAALEGKVLARGGLMGTYARA